ncbi:hypothetical protein NL676_000035 [Syzygium grande]|nr:hypothetical protein NL676_000035 [Syzygium grande]
MGKRKTRGKGGSHGNWRRHNGFAGGRATEDGPTGGWATSGCGEHNGRSCRRDVARAVTKRSRATCGDAAQSGR